MKDKVCTTVILRAIVSISYLRREQVRKGNDLIGVSNVTDGTDDFSHLTPDERTLFYFNRIIGGIIILQRNGSRNYTWLN